MGWLEPVSGTTWIVTRHVGLPSGQKIGYFRLPPSDYEQTGCLGAGPLAEGVKGDLVTSDTPGHNEYGLMADGEQIWLAKGGSKAAECQ